MIHNKIDPRLKLVVFIIALRSTNFIDKLLIINDMNLLSCAIVKVESFRLLVETIDFYQIASVSTLSYDDY